MITIAAASGNIFGYLWAFEAPAGFNGPEWAKCLCPRGKGLGLDGLFLLQDFEAGKAWDMEHWEPDGQRTFCSNGTRAAAAVLQNHLVKTGQTLSTDPFPVCSSDENVWIRVEGCEVGLRIPEGAGYGLRPLERPLLDLPHAYGFTGTPHLIVEVPSVKDIDLPQFAPPLRYHPELPGGANVSIIEKAGEGLLKIRSWERGVEGETLCCGQGCAVAGAWLASQSPLKRWRFIPAGEDPVTISLESLKNGEWQDMWLSGPARCIGQFIPDQKLL